MKVIKRVILLFVVFLLSFVFSMTVIAAEGPIVEEIESSSRGAAIKISYSKKMSAIKIYQKDSSGKWTKFFEDDKVDSTSKSYFITKYRLSTESKSTLKVVAVLGDGTEISTNTDIGKIPEAPSPSESSPSPSQSNSPSPSSSQPTVTSVSVTPTSVTMEVGDTKKLSVTALPSGIKTTYTWSSSNAEIAKVDSTGRVTALKEGDAVITVKSKNGKKASCKVKINKASSEEKVVLNVTSKKLYLNESPKSFNLKYTIKNAKSNSVKIKIAYSGGTENVVKYEQKSGNILAITAIASGTAKITVTSSTGKSASCIVNVQASKGKTEILFVGNSKTYKKQLTDKFKGLATAAGKKVEVSRAADGGKTLNYIATKSNKSLDELTQKNNYNTITGKAYDYVIIQEQTAAYSSSDSSTYVNGAKKVAKLVRAKNPNINIFVRQTWIYKDYSASDMNRAINNTTKVISEISARGVILDGITMYEYKGKYSDINLFSDERHQSDYGAYLTASAIYCAIYGKTPENLSYTAGLDATKAKKLRKFAWDIYDASLVRAN